MAIVATPCFVGGATLTVETTYDSGAGSLRQAIQDAAPGDTIDVSVTGVIALTNGQLAISKDLTVIGPGAANLAVSASYRSRVFQIESNCTVSISGLAIRQGRAPDGTNASNPVAEAGGKGADGGGVYNMGRLTLTACEVHDNSAGRGGCGSVGGSGGHGAGVYNAGTLSIIACTVFDNTAGSGFACFAHGGNGGNGGGIHNAGTLTAASSTFSGNSSGSGAAGVFPAGSGGNAGDGGAIYNSGQLSLTACTLARNSSGRGGNGANAGYFTHPGNGGNGGSGGGVYNAAAASAATLRSTLVGLNTLGDYGRAGTSPNYIGFVGTFGVGPDGAGQFHSEGHNLISMVFIGANSGFTNGVNGDLVGEGYTLDPKLGTLQNNGGATFTIALLSDSPALDAGDDALLGPPFDLERDQRGVTRKSGSQVDIGAFEYQGVAPVWLPTSAPNMNWGALACSADGRKLVAAVKGGRIFTSPDAGATWTVTSAPATNWSALASSANGSNLVATVAVFDGGQFQRGGPIYVSADAGVTWIPSPAPVTNWSAVSCSADGSKMVAVAGGAVTYIRSAPSGPIYRSIDFGATWVPTSVDDANCTSLASSADGSRLVAAAYLGPFHYSRDSGATWQTVPTTFAYLVSVASSANGEKLVAGTFDPFHGPGFGGHFNVVLSTNTGATWNYAAAGDVGRGLVAASADGTGLIAAGAANGFGTGGPILVSTNSGDTWTANGAPVATWSAVAVSADGGRFIAAAAGRGIWSLDSSRRPRLEIAARGSNIVLSWVVPSTAVVLEQSPDLTPTNWTEFSIPRSLNVTNLQQEAVFAPQLNRQFFRLKR